MGKNQNVELGHPKGPIDELKEGFERLERKPEPQVIKGKFAVRENGQSQSTQINTDERQIGTDEKGGSGEGGTDETDRINRRDEADGERGPEPEPGRILQGTEEELQGILTGLGIERTAGTDAAVAAAVIRVRAEEEGRARVEAVMAEAEANHLPQLIAIVREKLAIAGKDSLGEDIARAVKKVVGEYAAVKRVTDVEKKTKGAVQALVCLETLEQVRRYLEHQTVIDNVIGLTDDKKQWDRLYALQNQGKLSEEEVRTLLALLVATGRVPQDKAGLYPNSTAAKRQAEDIRSLKPAEWTRAVAAVKNGEEEEAGPGAKAILERGLRQAARLVLAEEKAAAGADRTDKTDKTDGTDRREEEGKEVRGVGDVREVGSTEEMMEARVANVLYQAMITDAVTETTRATVEWLADNRPERFRQLAGQVGEGELAKLVREEDWAGVLRRTGEGYGLEQAEALRGLLLANPQKLAEAAFDNGMLKKFSLDIAAEIWDDLSPDQQGRLFEALRGTGDGLFSANHYEWARQDADNYLRMTEEQKKELSEGDKYSFKQAAMYLVSSGLPNSVELGRRINMDREELLKSRRVAELLEGSRKEIAALKLKEEVTDKSVAPEVQSSSTPEVEEAAAGTESNENWLARRVEIWLEYVGDKDPEKEAVLEIERTPRPYREEAIMYLLRHNPPLLSEIIGDNRFLRSNTLELAGMIWVDLSSEQQDALLAHITSEGMIDADLLKMDLPTIKRLVEKREREGRLPPQDKQGLVIKGARLLFSRQSALVDLAKKVVFG